MPGTATATIEALTAGDVVVDEVAGSSMTVTRSGFRGRMFVVLGTYLGDEHLGEHLVIEALPGYVVNRRPMTGTEAVEVRTTGTGGICTRELPAADVPAEVAFLASTGKAQRIEVRAVGAETWMRVG